MGTDFSDLSPRGDEDYVDSLTTNRDPLNDKEVRAYPEEEKRTFLGIVGLIIFELLTGWMWFLPLAPIYFLFWLIT
jgi:hypothetical protein